MFALGAVSFLYPAALAALAVVPALWWLLRVLPPRPRAVRFPAFFLLKGLRTEEAAAARTPWWLLLLRALAVTFFILALAGPVKGLDAALPGRGGPVLIAVDNGWAAAAQWQARADKMKSFLPRIRRDGRAVIFLPTAPAPEDSALRFHGPMDAGEAEKWISRLQPRPWPADHAGARDAFAEVLKDHAVSHALFFSDGLEQEATRDFLETLQRGGGLRVVRGAEVNRPYILRQAGDRPGLFSFTAERLAAGAEENLQLVARDGGGGALDTHDFFFPAGAQKTEVAWDLLPGLRGRAAQAGLRFPEMASAVFLTDSRWRRHPVGIVSAAAAEEGGGVLNEAYYLRRALETGGALAADSPEVLVKQELSAIVWPDSAPVTGEDRAALRGWVEAGGFLIRFSGPNLAAHPEEDALLPVALRRGQRSMEGAMTWEKPLKIAPAPEESPLAGLAVPEDVTVSRQLLADPVPETFEKTWLRLEDGTPLVTGGAMGSGFVVLVHTTAGPDWSNFCYSGLYVETLRRLTALSAGVSGHRAQTALPPLMLMDGFGRLHPAGTQGIVRPVDPAKGFTPSPRTPPGIYGDGGQFSVFSLGDHLPPLRPLESLPPQVEEESYALSGETDLKPDFFRIALLLLLADTVATLFLRGLLFRPAAVFAAFLLFAPAPAAAQQDAEAADLVSGIYLAYVETGDAETDRVSHNGLSGLAEIVKLRTTIDARGARSVNPAADDLRYYPFLYWPMARDQKPLSAAAARNLQAYMSAGGLVFFDTRDSQFGDAPGATIGTETLRGMAQGLQIPALAAVGGEHILTRSFYLLEEFPGRFSGGTLWAEETPGPGRDGITSVLIGGNDWAAAWSADPGDMARFDIVPGGAYQREIAYRFGVNLVMMALAGSYKADQVHVPHILERMQR